MEKMGYVLTKNFVLIPVRFFFFLSLPFIFTLLAASISYFLTDGIKFYVVLPTKIVSFVF